MKNSGTGTKEGTVAVTVITVTAPMLEGDFTLPQAQTKNCMFERVCRFNNTTECNGCGKECFHHTMQLGSLMSYSY